MTPYPHPFIAREGWPFLAALVLPLLGIWAAFGFVWTIPLWLALIFVLQFFRDPGRKAPDGSDLVISPADGRIVVVGPARDPYLDRDAIKVSVFMNVFNVHSNRSPIEGVVRQRWYQPGTFLNAALDKASTENERNALHIETRDGKKLTCVQVAGLIARRILCYVDVGDALVPGQRYGFIRFGSRVDLYLPVGSTPRVAIGDIVLAGETVLANF